MISTDTHEIHISINGENHNVSSNSTLNQALLLWLGNADTKNDKKYVVALNQNFIPRALYDSTVLKADDNIELLSPMAGG